MLLSARRLDGALVGLGGALVLLLVDLVANGAHGTGDTAGDGVIASVALGLLLVGLLGSSGGGTLDSLGDVLGGVVERVADLTDDTLVRLVGVGSRHFECGWLGWFGLGKRRLF
jgi:hypothetical protein